MTDDEIKFKLEAMKANPSEFWIMGTKLVDEISPRFWNFVCNNQKWWSTFCNEIPKQVFDDPGYKKKVKEFTEPAFKPFRDPALVKPVVEVAIATLKELEFPNVSIDTVTRLRAARCLAYEAGLNKEVAELDKCLAVAEPLI